MTYKHLSSLATGLLWLVCGVAAARAAAPVPVVPRFAKFEAAFTLAGQTGNPFDPAVNDIEVTFAGPGGRSVTIPAFWDGDRWRVRFAPVRLGLYALTVRRGGTAVRPADLIPARFRCIPSFLPGFVRRDPQTTQRFVFDDGRTYYPLGMNAAWTGGDMPDYAAPFALMHGAGMNWARVWMTFWDGKALEWSPDKSQNPAQGVLILDAARRWDAIFDAAARNGVYVQMTLQHHGQYTEKTDPNWRDNPFNRANGGSLTRPDDFFTDPEAKRLTRAKYRYVVARWGYSTHLLAWELFNEVQNITEAQGHFADVVAWHKAMAAYLRSVDVNHHLLTTSVTVPHEPLAGIGLDYDQPHEYTHDLISYFAGLGGADKPLFVGEWGPDDAKTGMTEQTLHDGLWASLMAPTAGAGQFWYWNDVIAHRWWPQFASASGFLRAGGLAAGRMPLERVAVRVQTGDVLGDLSFAPTGGWSKATRDTVTVAQDGEAPDLRGIPSFIQGGNHRDMMPQPIMFLLDCPTACRFRVDIGTVAKAGAYPALTVDDARAAAIDFPASGADHEAGQSLSAELTAGPHRVALSNAGADWFVASHLTVTRYAPPVAVLAKGGSRRVVFWAYSRDRAGAAPIGATLLLNGLAPGVYTARLWDTWQGRALPPVPVTRRGHWWEVTLPAAALGRDVAGVVEAAHS